MADRSIRSSEENQELAAFRKEHGRKWRIALRQAIGQFSASDVLRAVYHREGPDLPLQTRVTHENSPEVQRRLELFCAVFVMLGEGATINVPRTAPDATKLALAMLAEEGLVGSSRMLPSGARPFACIDLNHARRWAGWLLQAV